MTILENENPNTEVDTVEDILQFNKQKNRWMIQNIKS